MLLVYLRRIAAIVALGAGLALPVPAVAGDHALSPDQVEAVERLIQDYLKKNPKVIVDSLQTYSRQQKQLAEGEVRKQLALHREELEYDPTSVVGGNLDGDVSVVEFFDYRCPYCKQVLPILAKLRKEDRNLRFVYKEFPVLGPDSLLASRAALASRPQGKYEAFHDALMASRGQLTETTIIQIAAEVGLDTERLKSDMAAPEINDIIDRNYRLAQTIGITATPSFVIGDRVVRGAAGADDFKKFIANARTICLTC